MITSITMTTMTTIASITVMMMMILIVPNGPSSIDTSLKEIYIDDMIDLLHEYSHLL